MKRYFVSYSRQRPEGARLRRVLMDTGLNVWRDVESLNVGVPTTPAIEKEVPKSHGGLLWINGAFLASDYIRTVEVPAFESALLRQPMVIVPVFDGIAPTEDKERLDRIAPWIREHQGLVLDPCDGEAAERQVARRCVQTHVTAAFEDGQEPLVRMVTYDDTAPLRDQAVLNFDWSDHMESDTLDEARRSELRWALTTATKALKATFGATEIPISIKAHLGFAVALGHEFSKPTGCKPVVVTDDEIRWSTDADSHAQAVPLREETLSPGPAGSSTAALEVSVSRYTTPGVDAYINLTGRSYRCRKRFIPIGGPSRHSLDGPPAAATWARQIGNAIIELNDRADIDRVDLFLAAPIQLAVLIGYWLNSAGPTRIMNWRGKTGPYEPLWTVPS